MFTDITGKRRLKACLHLHTTASDGNATPEQVKEMYEKAGYDILAITDHYVYHPAGQHHSLALISGNEYHFEGYSTPDSPYQVFHVVALDLKEDPKIDFESFADSDIPLYGRIREAVTRIRQCGGLAVLAHPAWSLNAPDQVMACCDFDATEVYNSVSGWGMSDRPYSGQVVDMLATRGVFLPLLATDDAHYYDGDQMRGITMLEADAVEELGFVGAVKAGRFYATQGPEIHLERVDKTHVRVRCTPASKIVFFSNVPCSKGRVHKGEDLTEAVYELVLHRHESFIRAEVTDENGLQAWSNILVL